MRYHPCGCTEEGHTEDCLSGEKAIRAAEAAVEAAWESERERHA